MVVRSGTQASTLILGSCNTNPLLWWKLSQCHKQNRCLWRRPLHSRPTTIRVLLTNWRSTLRPISRDASYETDAALAARLQREEEENRNATSASLNPGRQAREGSPGEQLPAPSAEQALAAAMGKRMGKLFGMNEDRAAAHATNAAQGTSWAFGKARKGIVAGASAVQDYTAKRARQQEQRRTGAV